MRESDDPMKITDWEVKQLATQIYAQAQANPRKSTTNAEIARNAIIAAIDFQVAWSKHGQLKKEFASPI